LVVAVVVSGVVGWPGGVLGRRAWFRRVSCVVGRGPGGVRHRWAARRFPASSSEVRRRPVPLSASGPLGIVAGQALVREW